MKPIATVIFAIAAVLFALDLVSRMLSSFASVGSREDIVVLLLLAGVGYLAAGNQQPVSNQQS